MLAGIRAGLQTAGSPLVEIQPSRSKHSERSVAQFSAAAPIEPALVERSVLLGVTDPSIAAVLSQAIRAEGIRLDRKSTRLNSSHLGISYAVFCLKKKTS